MAIEPLRGKLRDIIEFRYVKEEALHGSLQWMLRNKTRCVKCNSEPPASDCLVEHPDLISLSWKDVMDAMPDLFKKEG